MAAGAAVREASNRSTWGGADREALKRKGFRVDGRSATALVLERKRSACAFKSSAVGPRVMADRAAVVADEGAPWFGATASHVARTPPPPSHSAFNVDFVITTVSS